MTRSRLRAIGIAASVAFFTVAGAAMLLFGAGYQRLGGLVVTLMFGGTGAALAIGYVLGRRGAKLAHGDVVLPGGAESRGLVLPVPAARLRGAFVGAFCLAIAITISVAYPASLDLSEFDRWVMGACAAVIWIVIALMARGLLGPPPMLALTPSGVLVRTAEGASFVPWDNVRGARVFEMRGISFLGVDVEDPARVQRQGGARWLWSVERSVTGNDLSVPVTLNEGSPEDLAALVEHYRVDESARSGLGVGAPGIVPVRPTPKPDR